MVSAAANETNPKEQLFHLFHCITLTTIEVTGLTFKIGIYIITF